MITKREVLERFVKTGYCTHIDCSECAYSKICGTGERLSIKGRLQRIGAMAILRMFKEKEEPLLSVGTKIRFSNEEIATVTRINSGDIHYYVLVFEDGNKVYTDYLIRKTWGGCKMNEFKSIIEDVRKSDIISKKVIEKIIEIIGQEKWHELYDEYNDVITTTGELTIILNSLKLENEQLRQHKKIMKECYFNSCLGCTNKDCEAKK